MGLQLWLNINIERRHEITRTVNARLRALTIIELGLVREMKESLEVISLESPEEMLDARAGINAGFEQLAQATREEAAIKGEGGGDDSALQRIETLRRVIEHVEVTIDRMVAATRRGESPVLDHQHPDRETLEQIVDVELVGVMKEALADAEIDVAEAERADALYTRTTMTLAIVLPLVCMGILMAISQAILRPLHRDLSTLRAGTARAASGDLTVPIPISNRDELGELALSFNTMQEVLRQQQDQLKQQNSELERARAHLTRVAADLDSSNRELDVFAQVVSHDLRAPLRALSNYSRFLQEDCADQLNSTALEYVQGIAQSAQRMDALVVGVLDYSRIGRVDIEVEPVDVPVLLERIIAALHLRERADVTLPSTPLIVWARPLRLEQVLTNLLDNAAKFYRSGSRPQVTVEWTDRGQDWELAVRDNGIGVDPKHFEKLFNMFQRLHTQSQYQGTGLGLAIVKRAVEEHGGKVWIESQPGQGTVFRFTLPKQPAPARSQVGVA
jgi:signal transduction histidine kinase